MKWSRELLLWDERILLEYSPVSQLITSPQFDKNISESLQACSCILMCAARLKIEQSMGGNNQPVTTLQWYDSSADEMSAVLLWSCMILKLFSEGSWYKWMFFVRSHYKILATLTNCECMLLRVTDSKMLQFCYQSLPQNKARSSSFQSTDQMANDYIITMLVCKIELSSHANDRTEKQWKEGHLIAKMCKFYS